MLRGHNRAIPARLALLHGNPSDRTISNEPEGVDELWMPPRWMDDEQREQWHYGVEKSPIGILTQTDRDTLITWVCACVEYVRATVELRRSGQLVENRHGEMVMNPLFNVIDKQTMIMFRTADRLGFNPMARAALGRAGIIAPATNRHGQIGAKLTAYLEAKPDKLDTSDNIL